MLEHLSSYQNIKQLAISGSFPNECALDRQSWLFTGILPNGYGPPSGFCYDFFCRDQPIMVSSALISLK
jgi:hypothetical protein